MKERTKMLVRQRLSRRNSAVRYIVHHADGSVDARGKKRGRGVLKNQGHHKRDWRYLDELWLKVFGTPARLSPEAEQRLARLRTQKGVISSG